MRFLPPTPTLEPLRPASYARWLDEVRDTPPVTLDAVHRRRLAGLLAAYLEPELPLDEDPAECQREGAPEPLPPFHHRGRRRSLDVGWSFEGPMPDPEVPAVEQDDTPWWWDLVHIVPADERVWGPAGMEGGVIVAAGESEVWIGRHAIEITYDEDYDDDVVAMVQQVTGWIPVEEDDGPSLGPLPVVCPACMTEVVLACATPMEPLSCSDCGADMGSVRGLPRPPRAPHSLVAALVDVGWVDVLHDGAPVDLDAPESGAALARMLLNHPSVRDLYATDAQLQAFLEDW